MEKDDAYYFHQTPSELAKDIIDKFEYLFADGDILYEPFKGEGSFYNAFPDRCQKLWAEITEGKDYQEETVFDWVITNPPFRLEGETGRENAFWKLTDYFTKKARKGVIFLGNDYCMNTITPQRQKKLQEQGWGLTHLTMVNVKKWRGRYFVLVFQPTTNPILTHFIKNY
jgi:hypothetical protein